MIIQKNTNTTVRIALVIGLLLVIYAIVAYFYHLPPFRSENKSYEIGEQVTNMKRSDTEKEATEVLADNPEQKLQNEQTDTPTPPQTSNSDEKQVVNVLLTNAGIYNTTVEASGMVTNLVEDGGTCTYVFTNGANVLTKQTSTLINPTSTTCRTVSFPVGELMVNGVWKVKVSYESANSKGVSNVKEFTK